MSTQVVAISPNWRWDNSPLPTDTLRPPCSPPLEWAYLARGLSGELKIIDAYQSAATPEDVARQVAALGAQIVVISSIPNMLYWRCPPFSVISVIETIRALKSVGFDGVSVVVGPHGTHSPAWIAEVTGADIVWRGSSDVQLARAIRTGELATSPFAFTEPGTGLQIAVDHAMQIPEADLSVFEQNSYLPHAWSLTAAERAEMGAARGLLLEASRGCPWSCSYCAKGPVRDRFERRSVDLLAIEIKAAKRAGWDYVFFIDETFNIRSKDLERLIDELSQAEIRFGFQGRPDLIDDAFARRLANAGCVYAELGVDVAGDLLSRDMGRRQHLDRAERGIAAAASAIPIVRYNRLNTQTLDYRELYPASREVEWDVPVDPIYPYPGAPLGEAFMSRNGMGTFDWPFAEQYSWWLRIEVSLQRQEPDLSDDRVRLAQSEFMALPREDAAVVAESMRGIETLEGLHNRNKSIGGHGGRLHLRDTGAK
jgi:anaerobic magnesium-protoporphyrin IX monomethyl ester cyclase